MDWRKLTEAVAFAKTLDEPERAKYLTQLTLDSPDIGKQVERLLNRAKAADGFMMTSADDFENEAPSQAIGEGVDVWKITEIIGSGGMGDIYKAVRNDGLYDQTVALKVMRGANETRKAHFQKERQRLAQLNHPGIATILDGGATPHGNPYMAMEYVDGQPIVDYARQNKLSLSRKLNLFKSVCRAIAHAHANLVLHRDIKSDNILVDGDGRIKLIDFGIATLLDDDAATDTGPFTLATAAPEQLNGQPVSVQSDIFALGVLLHDLVTGELPEREANGSVSLHASLADKKDLHAITAKALSTVPEDRYASADALEAEIEAFLTQHPVAARQGGSFYKLFKFVRRAPVATALGSAFIAALVIGLGATTYYANQATQEAARANDELARAEWNVEQADLRNDIANGYADALQRAFGDEADVDRLTKLLLEHLETSTADYEQNPQSAATTTFAIGRHFLNRNDYVTARKVFEPWVEAGYGSPEILNYGQILLGFAYSYLGERELAAKTFQTAVKYYPGTFAENTPGHASAAVQAALFSGEDVDIDQAKTIVLNLIETEEAPFMQMYLRNQIFQIESKRANWDAAYKYIREAVDVIDSGTYTELSGQDTNRMNLANLETYHRQNMDAAEEQANIVRNIAEQDKGESRELGHANAIAAIIARSHGDLEGAENHMEKALQLFEKYTGKSRFYTDAKAQHGIILADANNISSARQTLAALRADLTDTPSQWPIILQVYIEAKANGIEAAQNLVNDSPLDLIKIRKSLKQNYYMQELEQMGLDFSSN